MQEKILYISLTFMTVRQTWPSSDINKTFTTLGAADTTQCCNIYKKTTTYKTVHEKYKMRNWEVRVHN